ncbi:MAG: ccr4 associated factor [Trizodia sp. TS-e1964]|nr:MAG: ccr4 associated factor [Trizodia sp. TS-e1964]
MEGRILNDAFIYHTNHSQSFRSSIPQTADPADPSYLIEVDSAEAAKLAKHIKRYKLRSKFDVRLLDEGEWEAWSLWTPPTDRWTPHAIPPDPSAAPTQKYIGCEDTRAPRLGKRIVVQGGSAPEALGKLEETSLDAYTVRRMLYGVPEGQAELLPEVALPLESNIDLMGGIDFQKGCYVGQELTIRTHHTGVVRKRILPVNIYPVGDSVPLALAYDPATKIRDLPPPGTIIVRVGKKGRNIGKWLGGVGNIGLALCRLEVMVEHKDNDKSTPNDVSEEFALEWSDGEVRIKAFVPSWHPQASTLR